MQLFDPNNPNEKKKMIAAGVLGLSAIVVLGYVFFGGSSSKPTTNNSIAKASPSPTRPVDKTNTVAEDSSSFQPIVYNPILPAVSEAASYQPKRFPSQRCC